MTSFRFSLRFSKSAGSSLDFGGSWSKATPLCEGTTASTSKTMKKWPLIYMSTSLATLHGCAGFTVSGSNYAGFVGRRNLHCFGRRPYRARDSSSSRKNDLVMRDISASYWFKAGDSVRVIEDVTRAGQSLKGMVGKVIETWEKCDVDPTCCCAEQVDCAMAVRVEFSTIEEPGFRSAINEETFFHFFAEEELVKVQLDETQQPQSSQSDIVGRNQEDSMPFDGKTCKAFKLEQLGIDKRRRGIAAFEPRSFKGDE